VPPRLPCAAAQDVHIVRSLLPRASAVAGGAQDVRRRAVRQQHAARREAPGRYINRVLRDVALRMAARTGFGFDAGFGCVTACVAAIDFAAGDRSDHRTVTGLVAALNRRFLHGGGSRTGRRSGRIVRYFDRDDLRRRILDVEIFGKIRIIERFGHAQRRRNELRIDWTARSQRIGEKPLALRPRLRGERIKRPLI
jgi:hypothetical protein